MARFYGAIGYALQVESKPGVWTDGIVEKNYRGDVVLDQRRWNADDKANDNLNFDNSISIVADDYAHANIGHMKYVVWNGIPWKIKSFTINRPRLVLQIGGIYNGKRPPRTP